MKAFNNTNWSRQEGAVRIGTVIWLLMFVAMIIIGKEAIPVKIKSSKFEDSIIDTAKFATRGFRSTNETIQRDIMNKARELEIPLEKKNCTVKKSNGRIRITAEYTITLEFPFYEYDWHFEHYVDRPVFII